MKRASAILVVLAILILGFLVGVVATHLFYAQRFQRAGSFSEMASEFFTARLERELDLTVEQRDAIGAILDQAHSDAEALRAGMRPKVERLIRKANTQISEVLTDEQRRRFAELRERHRGGAEHFFLGPPGPMGRRGPPGHDWHRPHGPFRPGEAPPEDEAVPSGPEDG
jgi:Spy/CpxP family protein refolding chaperone